MPDWCWNCGSTSLYTQPDPAMGGVTDEIRCAECGEAQEADCFMCTRLPAGQRCLSHTCPDCGRSHSPRDACSWR